MKARERRAKRERWTEEEIAYLKEHYATEDIEKMAEKLGKAVHKIRYKARTYGLKRAPKNLVWTEEKIAYLRENREKFSAKELAEHVGCSPTATQGAIYKYVITEREKNALQAYSPKERKPYYGNPDNIGNNQNPVTVATMTIVCSCILDNMTVNQIAALTERTPEQVREVITEATESGYMKWIQERREDSLFLKENLTAGRSCVWGRG